MTSEKRRDIRKAQSQQLQQWGPPSTDPGGPGGLPDPTIWGRSAATRAASGMRASSPGRVNRSPEPGGACAACGPAGAQRTKGSRRCPVPAARPAERARSHVPGGSTPKAGEHLTVFFGPPRKPPSTPHLKRKTMRYCFKFFRTFPEKGRLATRGATGIHLASPLLGNCKRN